VQGSGKLEFPLAALLVVVLEALAGCGAAAESFLLWLHAANGSSNAAVRRNLAIAMEIQAFKNDIICFFYQ